MELKRIPKFRRWLHSRGAEILEPTNPFELLRFKCKHGTGVVYSSKKKGISVSCAMVTQAYEAYLHAKPWDGRPSRGLAKNTSAAKKQLVKRDGCECFYCGNEFGVEELTQEHLLSSVHGGTNRVENKVLACRHCNELAGNLPVIEKVKLREKMRFY